MYKSNTGRSGGTTNPDRILITRLSNGEFEETWFRLEWDGQDYEDCWINFRESDAQNLDDLR